MKQTIFVDNITVIDLSRWSFNERVFTGDSLNLHCQIGGPVDTQEGVVVDFSQGKKDIKRAIDHHIEPKDSLPLGTLLSHNGFDHKLILPADPLYRPLSGAEQSLYSQCHFSAERVSDTHCTVTSDKIPQVRLELPVDALRLLPADVLFDLEAGNFNPLERFISDFLSTKLHGLSFAPLLDRKPHARTLEHILGPDYHLFTYSYTHGLRNSSSYGCQNILHGHSSYVASSNQKEASDISEFLDGAYIHDGLNWANSEDRCAYYTESRGSFSYTGARCSQARLVDVGAEPSIENIALFVADRLRIKDPFFLSEGLQKGCYWEP